MDVHVDPKFKYLKWRQKIYLAEYCFYIINACLVQVGLGEPINDIIQYDFKNVNEEDVNDLPLIIKRNI